MTKGEKLRLRSVGKLVNYHARSNASDSLVAHFNTVRVLCESASIAAVVLQELVVVDTIPIRTLRELNAIMPLGHTDRPLTNAQCRRLWPQEAKMSRSRRIGRRVRQARASARQEASHGDR